MFDSTGGAAVKRISAWLAFLLLWGTVNAQIPRPQDVFGFPPGGDYKLAGYQQMREYYQRLDAASDRIRVVDMGPTVEGRTMMLAIISSEANMENLETYRELSEKLARARIEHQEAGRLAETGKTVVWIDGGLHATEVAHAQHSPELAYRVVSEESTEMRFIRDNVILLQVPVLNPDGLDIVVDWYQKNLGTEFETSTLPTLYHKYAGHDNNRDFYMSTQPETRNVNRILYQQWYPQIVYNHHQSPPFPARIFVPPFAEPMNPRIPPLVIRGIDLIGSAISTRLESEQKSGIVSRVKYTTWWNGGLRTTPYYHNMVGILTETTLHRYATPREYPLESLPESFADGVPALEPSAVYPNPWQGGWWRMGDAVDYMVSASIAVLDVAARHRSQWLYNIYLMGRQAIEKGLTGAPYAYLVSQDQHDPSAAAALVEAVLHGGVEVERAESDFQVRNDAFGSGTYIIRTAQPFRPYIMDLMEPQVYPERRLYPTGPPKRPYDITGWTLPMQMGVDVELADQPLQVETSPVQEVRLPSVAEPVAHADRVLIDRSWNASYRLINELLARGVEVSVSTDAVRREGHRFPPGCFVVRGDPPLRQLRELARRHRIPLYGLDDSVRVPLLPLTRPRIGVYKSALANTDEGWTRWVLDDYGFEYQSITNQDIRTGGLGERFDVVVLPSQSAERMRSGHLRGSVPPQYTGGMGIEGFAQLKVFTEQGGILVTLDAACELPVQQFEILVESVLEGVKAEEFYCPGSLLRIRIDPTDPIGFGMRPDGVGVFAGSKAFDLTLDRAANTSPASGKSANQMAVTVVSYGAEDVLMSGWILGEQLIQNKSAVVRANLGRGQVVLLGFRTQFRGQPHGTFKLLFNSIYLGGMDLH